MSAGWHDYVGELNRRGLSPRLAARPLPGGEAQIALGDSAAAERSLDFAFERMQKPDGSFPQNTRVDGAENWTNL